MTTQDDKHEIAAAFAVTQTARLSQRGRPICNHYDKLGHEEC